MTMISFYALYRHATAHPGGTAFIHDDVVWTYQDLLTGAEQFVGPSGRSF